MTFSVTWQWLSSLHERPEVRQTGAKLKIVHGRDVFKANS
jgi:hypothetical protein